MKGRTTKFRRWISFVSVFALLACTTPAFAAETDSPAEESGFLSLSDVPDNIRFLLDTEASAGGAQALSANSSSAVSALQIVDTDDLGTIRVEDSQGNGTAHVFAVPVRYETDEGEIEFIDTSMTQESFVTSLFSPYDYRSTANSFTLQYAQQPDTGLNMDGDFTMAVYNPEDLPLANGTVDQTAEGNGRITYPEAFGEHTYLEYINTTTGVKENIVLEENIGKNRFDFVFESDTHQPVLSEDGTAISIVKKDDPEQQAAYTISPLYVYDSCVIDTESEVSASGHQHFTEDCHYEVALLEDGSYRITSVVSEEFLNDPETTYPVTIDPPISNGASTVTDTYVFGGQPGATHGSEDHLRFGRSGSYLYFTLIRFDKLMESIPPNATVTGAEMFFKFRTGQTTGSTGALWRLTSYWKEGINYDELPSNASWQVNDATSVANRVNGYIDNYTFDVKELVQSWAYGTYPHYGVYLTYTSHAVQDYNSVVSSDGEAHRAPTLTVSYTVSSVVPPGLKANAIYFIKNYSTGKYIQAGNSGQKLTQWAFTGNTNQQWKLEHHGNGWYSFYPLSNTSLRIDVPNSKDINGQEFQMAADSDASHQQFRITRNGNGTYWLQPRISYISYTQPGASSRMAMEVTGASSANGVEIQMWTLTGEPQMKWVFEEAATVGEDGPYTEHTSSAYNCMSYALKHYSELLRPDGFVKGTHLAEAKAGVVSAAAARGIHLREIGENDVLNPKKEYRIAFRVGYHEIQGVGVTFSDFHFMLQHNDGTWSHKMGLLPSEDLGDINPSTYQWLNNYGQEYNEGTVYYAVSR